MKIDLETLTISGIVHGQVERRFTALDLLYAYLDRIAAIDKAGPSLNAILEINPEAPAIAAALDVSRESGDALGPLHGVPVLLKDNINTGDKLHTSAGSLALANSYAPEDAFLVTQLRNAGAIILGKANMTEWANFMTKNMPNGYSSRGGQVVNPYGADLDPGGSSSGSAVAVAAALCAVAVGTETSGSILSPAINNMLVGIKPTVGLISRSGIIPISTSQDTAGPLARTVADAAVMLTAMRSIDASDPITGTSRPFIDADYVAALDRDITGIRIGVPRKLFWDRLSDEAKQSAETTITTLSDLGAKIVDPADFENTEELGGSRVLIYEFKSGINAYLASLGPAAPVRTLSEIVEYNRINKKRALKYGQTVLRESDRLTSGTLTEPEYIRSRRNDLRLYKTEGIDRVMAKAKLDVLLFPSYWGCAVAARAGYPSVTVPTGFETTDKGKAPFGVALTGPAFSEALLIRCAHALEKRLDARIAPELTLSPE